MSSAGKLHNKKKGEVYTKVLIEVRGGVVHTVSTSEPAEFFLLDHDDLEQIFTQEELAKYFSSYHSTDVVSEDELDKKVEQEFEDYTERVSSLKV